MREPSGEFPQPPARGEADALRSSCPTHGNYYADELAANVQMGELLAADLPEDELFAVIDGNPRLARAYKRVEALHSLQETLKHPRRGLSRILSQSKTSLINPYADTMSEQLITALGERPDFFEVQQATVIFATQTTLVNRNLQRPAQGRFENILVNQFANTLLTKADIGKLCANFANIDKDELMEQARPKVAQAIAAVAAETGAYINEDFLLAKIGALRHNLTGLLKVEDIKNAMPEVEVGDAETQEMGRQNTAFAKQIQRILNYGVKSMIFPFEDAVPGMDAVYHHPRMLSMTLQGDQPSALVQVASADISAAEKLDKTIKKENVLSDDLTCISLGVNSALISIDGNGELFHGANSVNGIPLRTFFDQQHSLGRYETLRAALLARLFDAVAPAIIVDRLEAAGGRSASSEVRPVTNQGTAVINRLVLPRLRYLNNRNAKAVKKDFEQALEVEAREQDTPPSPQPHGRKLHEVEGFRRLLPKNSKGPSEKAIENAKAYFGNDYELPPGYTFVKTHERGDSSLGMVSGYLAMQRTVTIEENIKE